MKNLVLELEDFLIGEAKNSAPNPEGAYMHEVHSQRPYSALFNLALEISRKVRNIYNIQFSSIDITNT